MQLNLDIIKMNLTFANTNIEVELEEQRLYLHAKQFSWFCNILTFDPAINRETGASGQRYQDITLTIDRLNSVQLQHPCEPGGGQTII